MNRKSAADRDGFVGAVREITKALQMQFAAARAAAARPKVSSVADFASRYREKVVLTLPTTISTVCSDILEQR